METDRLVGGSVAGVIGGVVQEIYGFAGKALHLTDRTFLDYAGILYAFKPPTGFLEYVVTIMLHLILSGVLGIAFAYLIQLTSSNYYYFKAIGFSMVIWFLLGATGSIWRLPLFKEVPPGPALYTLGGALVFGVIMAFTLKNIEARTELV